MAKKSLPIVAWIFIGVFACASALGIASYYTLKKVFNSSSSSVSSISLKPGRMFGKSSFIGLLNIEGPILNPEDVYESLDEIEESKDLKALVVRINSPGGSVPPTQEIYNRILALREKVPVICSLADIAASGGYYIASACNVIFTNPGTLTGSIGVIMQMINLEDLYKWAKLKPLTMKSGYFKDIGSPLRAMRDDEKKLLQDLLDETHEQFKSDIAKGRSMQRDAVDAYADGRIFSGTQAIAYGFADEIGGKKEALARARKDAGVDDKVDVIEWPRKKEGLRAFLEGQTQSLIDTLNVRKQIFGSASVLQKGIPYFLPSHMFGDGL